MASAVAAAGSGGGGGSAAVSPSELPSAAAGDLTTSAGSPLADVVHHVTRRRTNSTIRPPRRLDSPSPDRFAMSASPSTAASSTTSTPGGSGSGTRAGSAAASATTGSSSSSSTHRHGTRASVAAASASTTTTDNNTTTNINTSTSNSSAQPPIHRHLIPKSRVPQFPLNDAYVPTSTDGKAHPRDSVPADLKFPPGTMAARVRKEDGNDRLLMAICDVLLSHENRALCPKEIAEVMFARDWLKNAGTTPFAHISTCIRSHTRRAQLSDPPYQPLLVPFELVGALAPHEVAAVGLVADERPAVKRGTLWYLNEALFGPGMGAEDPFARCRREAGLSTVDSASLRARGLLPLSTLQTEDGDDDDGGMGRGKRKRRASSAMIAALTTDIDSASVAMNARPAMLLSGNRGASAWQPSQHRRSQSSSSLSTSAPVRSSLPKLRLRLTSLEEVDNDSDGFTSDAARRRKASKKKTRRATSIGISESSGDRAASVESDTVDGAAASSEDDDDLISGLSRLPRAFSSASSSALLAQSLLAASNSTPAVAVDIPTHEAVSPDSLRLSSSSSGGGLFQRPRPHLSTSAPNLFSSFPSARTPEVNMDVDHDDFWQGPSDKTAADADPSDSADEDDYHEAMLRGDDFDFEWGSESYTTNITLPPFSAKSRSRELSLSLPEEAFDLKDDMDTASTPATTPRSPAASEEPELPPPTAAVGSVDGLKMGMEETLCGAFAGKTDEEQASLPNKTEGVNASNERSASSDSLASLVEDEVIVEPETPTTAPRPVADASMLAVPLPSPLALDLPPMLALTPSVDYDFVGHEDDDRSTYHAARQYHDNADDEDEDDDEDDIVTVKIEDDGSISLDAGSSSNSSRSSSAFPSFDSFSRRLHASRASPSSSSGSENGEMCCDGAPVVVSKSMLATGFPVPQHAPSPPETTDWSLQLDPDEFELDPGHSVDFMGPETVGLEELDLAWGGEESDQGETENDEHFKLRREQRLKSRRAEKVAATPTFLTGHRPGTPRSRSMVSKASTPTPAALRASLHGDDDDNGSPPPTSKCTPLRSGKVLVKGDDSSDDDAAEIADAGASISRSSSLRQAKAVAK